MDNPEYYTVWNYRREILEFLFTSKSSDEIQQILQNELKLVDSLLKKVPKSYWVWNHRRWTLEKCPVPLWSSELKIINYMLNLDPRNFHGWDYRRYVIKMSNISTPMNEFQYTTTKIHQNFSNFSAWHYRSKILSKAFPIKEDYDKQIQEDVELVRNAIFTEPKDQSAWLYQRFLFRKGMKLN
jgi:geranylgeranyl transferase type-2 subunit alpha